MNTNLQTALTNNGLVLEYIPENLQTEELCLIAVKSNGLALEFVLGKFKTKEVCTEAIKQNTDAIDFIKNAEVEFKDLAKEKQTEELCLAAVKENVENYNYLTKKHKSEKINLEVIKNVINADGEVINKNILDSIKDLKQAPGFYLKAVEQNGWFIKHVKLEFQTREMCLEAIKQTGGLALQYIVNQTEEICHAAVRENGALLQYVKNQTENICLDAINPHFMKAIHMSNEIAYEFNRKTSQTAKTSEILKLVKKQTKEICLIAVYQMISNDGKIIDEDVLDLINPEFKNPEFYLEAVECNGWFIKLLNPEDQTPEMWRLAIKQSPKILDQVKHIELV
jgi:hypothetical protein